MEIKGLGPGCMKCHKTEALVREAVAESGVDAKIDKVSDMLEIAKYGILGAPAVISDGEVKCVSKVPKKDEIKSWISK